MLYPRGGSGQLIDADGRPADPPGGRAVARIARGDRPLALVLHDPALMNEPELARALGSAAKLSVENEALRAEAMAQLHALQASRARIVETADGARRRLERDLHDGAQQRLLALSYDIRLARAGAKRRRRHGAGFNAGRGGGGDRGGARGAARAGAWHLPGDPHRGGARAGARDARRRGAAPRWSSASSRPGARHLGSSGRRTSWSTQPSRMPPDGERHGGRPRREGPRTPRRGHG